MSVTFGSIPANDAGWPEGVPVGTLWVQTADKTVGNTGTQTTLLETGVGTLTLPSSAVRVGSYVEHRHFAVYSSKSGPVGTLTIEVTLGGVSLGSVACDIDSSMSAMRFRMDIQWTIRAIGTSGTVLLCAKLEAQTSAGGGADTMDIFTITGSPVTINWETNSRVIDVLATWATPNASNTITTKIGRIDIRQPV